MAVLVVPSAVLVRFIWAKSGTPFAVNVLGGRKVSATTIDQGFANTLGAAIKAAFTSSAMNGQVGTTITLQNVGVRDISAPNRPEFRDVGAAVAGITAQDLLPPQVALCATLRTANAGKNYRGRYYQAGYTEQSNQADGTAAPGGPTTLVAWLTAVKDAMTASGLSLAIVSRTLAVTTDVTLIQVRDNTWDTIRKRAVAGI